LINFLNKCRRARIRFWRDFSEACKNECYISWGSWGAVSTINTARTNTNLSKEE